MKRSPSFPRHPALALALATAVLAACSGGGDDLVASGKELAAKQDHTAAIIQFKNALQKNPDLAEARLALGLSLLETGDPVSALVELTKARELQIADERVAPSIARAMVLVGDDAKLLSQFGEVRLREPAAQADLLTSLATASTMRNDVEAADRFLAQALNLAPGFAPALILQARLIAAKGDFAGALATIDGLLAKEPANDRALLLRGEVLWHGKKDTAGALDSFRKALAANPKMVAAHTSIMSLQGQQGDNAGLKTQFEALKKVAPNHPDTLFYESQLAFVEGEYKRTIEIGQRLLKVMPDNPRVLELVGAAEYRQQNYTQAEALLSAALKASPTQRMARQVLAQTYLRTGQAARAVETLTPVLDSSNIDAATITLAGEAYAQLGETRKADEAFARAAKLAPNDPRVRTSAAVAQLTRGNPGVAAAQLEAIAAEDKGTRADVALITARLRQGDTAGALKAIDGLERKTPEKPLAYNLRGRVLMVQRDLDGARRAFETAVKKDAAYFPAVASLAALDMAAGKPEESRKRLEAFAQANPKSHEPWIALHELALRTGATPTDAQALLRNGVKANGGSPAAHLALVNYLLQAQDAKSALTAAREAAAALPGNAAVLDALSRTQLVNGNAQEAAKTARELVAQDPAQPAHQLRLAEALLAAKDNAGTAAALAKALEARPGWVPARRAQSKLAVLERRFDDAVRIARELQKAEPKNPLGFTLEADAEASRQNWDAAIAATRSAHQLGKGSESAVRLYTVLMQGGKAAEAERFAADWMREQPKDLLFRYHLGDVAIARNNLTAAEGHYRAVLEMQPKHALAMNNIAWLMATQGRTGAVEMARKANELMPGRPALLDTLATALAAEGKLEEAVKTQKEAVTRAPADPSYKLGLARLLIKAGDKAYAKAELEDLARLGDRFGRQAEVAALLKSL